MPSQGHGVQEFMNLTTVEDQAYADAYKKSGGDAYTPSFHLYSRNTSMIFATFIFSDEMVPAGDAQDKCVYLELAPNGDRNNYAAFKPLEDMPDCSRSKNGWWNFHDPTVGIDVPTWNQTELYFDCTGKACEDTCAKKHGWWVWKNDKVKGTCYTYQVLTQVCITVAKYADTFGKVHWKFTGGCFKDGNPGRYEEAKPGNVYKFDAVPISVRADSDPYVVLTQNNGVIKEKKTGVLRLVALLLFIVGLGTGIGGAIYYKKLSGSGFQNLA